MLGLFGKKNSSAKSAPFSGKDGLENALLNFVGLYELAGLLDASNVYEKQSALIDECRKAGRPFLALMPMRHQFHCPHCGLARGEALVYLEDPNQELGVSGPQSNFGSPRGQYISLESSQLHEIFTHGKEPPADLVRLLSSVR